MPDQGLTEPGLRGQSPSALYRPSAALGVIASRAGPMRTLHARQALTALWPIFFVLADRVANHATHHGAGTRAEHAPTEHAAH